MAKQSSRVLLVSELGDIRIAVDALRVEAVQRSNPADVNIDVADILGIDRPAGARRHLRVSGEREWTLCVGEEVEFREVADRSLSRLPRLLQGLEHIAGLLGLVEQEDGFLYLLDPDLLLAIHDGAHTS